MSWPPLDQVQESQVPVVPPDAPLDLFEVCADRLVEAEELQPLQAVGNLNNFVQDLNGNRTNVHQ